MFRRLAPAAPDLRGKLRSTPPPAPTVGTTVTAKLILLVALAIPGLLVAPEAFARGFRDSGNAQTIRTPAATTVGVAELPPEGRKTYGLIRNGGPFPFDKDGVVFGNYENLLPPFKRGYYHEYTVGTPKARNRGARRIVCGGPVRNPERCYYTADHYSSFREIIE